jgi:hypothetical protein
MSYPQQENREDTQTVSRRRRRLLTGTLAGSGVLLSIQAKTALGGTICQSPSAMISGNTSPRPGDGTTCSGGRSPGFWKQPQKFLYWTGVSYPTFSSNIVPCTSGLGSVSPCDIKTRGTLVGQLFPGAPGGDKGIWEVLMWPTNYPTTRYKDGKCEVKGNRDIFSGKGQLLRALACAYLNAGYFGSTAQSYPMTQQQVKDMWTAVGFGGTYCPSGMSCGTNAMTASQIISYIESMYDINADVVNLCKQN